MPQSASHGDYIIVNFRIYLDESPELYEWYQSQTRKGEAVRQALEAQVLGRGADGLDEARVRRIARQEAEDVVAEALDGRAVAAAEAARAAAEEPLAQEAQAPALGSQPAQQPPSGAASMMGGLKLRQRGRLDDF